METRIPLPSSVTPGSGLNPAQRLQIGGPSWVAEVVSAVAGMPLLAQTVYTAASGAAITVEAPQRVELVPQTLPDASYSLEVTPSAITVKCSQPAGLVAALATLESLRQPDGVRCARIDDAPRFAYRGVHLDVGRHFFSIAFVRRYVALIASLGFNVFHWHLTEDQGWRIPIPGHPRLAEVAARRTEADGTTYAGIYTRQEIVDLVAYAGRLGVLVMPEIELPGHAQAAIAAYPELSCRGIQLPVRTEWGISDEVYCAGNEALFDFLDDVFDEIVALFPSRYVHIGGDECPKVRWKECSKCQERMRTEGLASEEELQSYVIGRAATMLAKRGRTAIGWDEILEGGLPAGTTVMSWRGTSGGKEAARLGHDVVMTPTSHCYFDYRQINTDEAPGFGIGNTSGTRPWLPIDRVYAFDPLEGLTQDEATHVIGGQANLWSEQLATEQLAEELLMPRLLAMAEVLWSAPKDRDFAAFAARARGWLARFSGWHVADVPELAE